MKKFVALLLLVSVIVSCEKKEALPPNTYKVNVSAPGVFNGIRAYIKIIDSRRQEIDIDTAMVVNEQFTFTGKVNSSAIRILSVNGVQGSLAFVLEPGELNIEIYKDSMQYSKIEGSKNNDGFNEYKENFRKINSQVVKLREEMLTAKRSGDLALSEEKNTDLQTISQKRLNYPHSFIGDNPGLDISLLILETQIIGQNQDLALFKKNVADLNEVINRNAANKFIGQKLNSFIAIKQGEELVSIGKKAPDFRAPTPNGDFITLEDVKGKATIIDFWAAWCGPCRRENPNVVKVYEKYHDKGLEIISVSLDGRGNQADPKKQWLKAIEDDKLTWNHVSSLMYFNDPVAQLYKINAIPAMFVLDENGIIVGKKLRGQALENKISELLD